MMKLKKLLLVCILSLSFLPVGYVFAKEVVDNYSNTAYSDRLQKQLFSHLQVFDTEFTIKFTGNTHRIDQQLERIMDVLKEENIYLYENISKWKAKYYYTGNMAKINFTVEYLTNIEQEYIVEEKVTSIAQTISTYASTDYEKVKAVNDYIVLNSEYSANTKTSQYAVYTLLEEQKAVCQAYALLAYLLLTELGVEAKYVKGNAGDVLHGWNLVNVDGSWYHLDVTWNDPIPNRENEISYKYFLVSDERMKETHNWIEEHYPIAQSTKFEHVSNEYFVKNE